MPKNTIGLPCQLSALKKNCCKIKEILQNSANIKTLTAMIKVSTTVFSHCGDTYEMF